MYKNYLPISKEYNRLYDNKLRDWIEWLKQILACHVKQCKSIESHCIRECIDDGEIQV